MFYKSPCKIYLKESGERLCSVASSNDKVLQTSLGFQEMFHSTNQPQLQP